MIDGEMSNLDSLERTIASVSLHAWRDANAAEKLGDTGTADLFRDVSQRLADASKVLREAGHGGPTAAELRAAGASGGVLSRIRGMFG